MGVIIPDLRSMLSDVKAIAIASSPLKTSSLGSETSWRSFRPKRAASTDTEDAPHTAKRRGTRNVKKDDEDDDNDLVVVVLRVVVGVEVVFRREKAAISKSLKVD